MTERAKRYFKFKKNRCPRAVKWLDRDSVYEGKLLSMTNRTVRLYAGEMTERRLHVDVSYDWLIPVR
jgi:hypothetical protein